MSTLLLLVAALGIGFGAGQKFDAMREAVQPAAPTDARASKDGKDGAPITSGGLLLQADSTIARERQTILVNATRLAAPAVVAITVTSEEVTPGPTTGDPFLDQFFGLGPRRRQAQSLGSGVIIDGAGYIATNFHVVAGAANPRARADIQVNLSDGRQFAAKYLGGDRDNDVAVLKVEGETLPAARLSSAQPIIGEWAIAIGNPFGYLMDDPHPTVTVGVISAVDRNFKPASGILLRHVIQTDAAINPGNSGGALVNALGEVIGINTFIFTGSSYSQGSIGLGFAIPIRKVSSIVQEIVKFGRIREFATGLSTDPAAAEAMGLAPGAGVLITEVAKGAPGAKAGIRPGDIVVGADGRRIRDLDELRSILRTFRVGDRVALDLLREGKTLRIEMPIEEWKP